MKLSALSSPVSLLTTFSTQPRVETDETYLSVRCERSGPSFSTQPRVETDETQKERKEAAEAAELSVLNHESKPMKPD